MKLLKDFPLDARSLKLLFNHKRDGSLWWQVCILCFGQQCNTEMNCMFPVRIETEL